MNTHIFKFRSTLLIVLALITLNLSAQKRQPKDDMKQKMTEQNEAFMIKKLELTEDESKKFMPIYKAYKAEIHKNRAEQKLENNKELSDKDAEAQLENLLKMKQKEIEIQLAYINKFKSVIPANKILKVFSSEREFKQKVIKNIKKRSQHSGDQTTPTKEKNNLH